MWPRGADLGKSDCYDLLWRITLVREPRKEGEVETLATGEAMSAAGDEEKIKRYGWRAASLTATLEGFRGNASDPCREGLTPVAPAPLPMDAT